MAYHTPMRSSKDYIGALKVARYLSEKVEQDVNQQSNDNFSIFPYSIFYVYYEQYLTIWQDTAINLSVALIAIFIVTFTFMGFDIISSLIIISTILSIIINLMGLMYWWSISLNAVSLVNLVMVIIFIR